MNHHVSKRRVLSARVVAKCGSSVARRVASRLAKSICGILAEFGAKLVR